MSLKPFIHSVKTASNKKPSFVILPKHILDKNLYFHRLDVNETLKAELYDALIIFDDTPSKQIKMDMPALKKGVYQGKPLKVL